MLANQAVESARAAAAERDRDGWKEQAAEWKGLYAAERDRAELLKSAGGDRREAQEATRFAFSILQTQHEEDKGEINLLRQENSSLRKSRVAWGVKGAAVGFGTCAASALPNILGR